MVKAAADDITKSEQEITKSNKSSFGKVHTVSHDKGKQIVFQVFILIGGVVLAFFVLEAGLRLFEKKGYTLDPCVSLDKDLHHVLIPNSSCRFKTDEWDVENKINNLGMRDNEVALRKNPDIFRILALGDSFTFGHGVKIDDSYVNSLEKKLNGKNKVEIINSGVFGYSPIIYYLYLTKKGFAFNPDMVVLFFTLTDFWEDRKRFSELKLSHPQITDEELSRRIERADAEFKFDLINSSPSAISGQKPIVPGVSYNLKSWLRKHVKTYGAIVDFIKKKERPVQQDVLYQGNIDKDIVALIRGDKISQEEWEELWKLPVKHLSMIADTLDKRNIRFVVVLIPEAVQVSDLEWPNRQALGLPEHFEDPRGPFQNELVRHLKGKNIEFVDLLDDFRESGIFPLYFSGDGHFRESGHKLAAELIFKKLNAIINEK